MKKWFDKITEVCNKPSLQKKKRASANHFSQTQTERLKDMLSLFGEIEVEELISSYAYRTYRLTFYYQKSHLFFTVQFYLDSTSSRFHIGRMLSEKDFHYFRVWEPTREFYFANETPLVTIDNFEQIVSVLMEKIFSESERWIEDFEQEDEKQKKFKERKDYVINQFENSGVYVNHEVFTSS